MSKIALRNITKYYGKHLVLDNISLDISDGVSMLMMRLKSVPDMISIKELITGY
jgi:ABC-type polar amino acid transport system ATPase subunit